MILIISDSKIEEKVISFDRWFIYRKMVEQGVAFIYNLASSRKEKNIDVVIKSFEELHKKKINCIILEEYIWFRKLKIELKLVGLAQIKIPIATFVSDYFLDIGFMKEFMAHNNVSIIFTLHESSYSFLRHHLGNKKIISIPYAVRDELFYKDEKKDIDISYTGFQSEYTPFRNRLKNTFDDMGKYKFLNLEHPGKRISAPDRTTKLNYSEIIKRSKFSIATPTIFNLSVKKYNEFMASKTLILGMRTGFPEHAPMKGTTIDIYPNYSDTRIRSIFDEALNDYEKYKLSLDQGMEYALENYTYKAIALKITDSLINNVDRDDPVSDRKPYFRERAATFKIFLKSLIQR
jgi:hypothetical protein